MKKALGFLILSFLLLLPLACVQRTFVSPVNPQILSATPTPSPTVATGSFICTITPTVTPVVMTESEPSTVTGTNNGYSLAESLGTLGSQDVFVNGYFAGTQLAPDNDYYSFTASLSGTWTIYLDCYLTTISPIIYVYDSTYGLIGTYSQNTNLAVTFTATGGQLYYLRVYGYGGTSYTAKIFHP